MCDTSSFQNKHYIICIYTFLPISIHIVCSRTLQDFDRRSSGVKPTTCDNLLYHLSYSLPLTLKTNENKKELKQMQICVINTLLFQVSPTMQKDSWGHNHHHLTYKKYKMSSPSSALETWLHSFMPHTPSFSLPLSTPRHLHGVPERSLWRELCWGSITLHVTLQESSTHWWTYHAVACAYSCVSE